MSIKLIFNELKEAAALLDLAKKVQSGAGVELSFSGPLRITLIVGGETVLDTTANINFSPEA